MTTNQPHYRILITGSRNWTNPTPIHHAYQHALQTLNHPKPQQITIVHGNAKGLDQLAAHIATQNGYQTEPHPANWTKHGKAAGPIRNQHMINLGAHLCYAFPLNNSPGTNHCLTHAHKANIPTYIVTPHNTIHQHNPTLF